EKIHDKEISWINCAPSAFYPLLSRESAFERLQSLRWVFLGGEPINPERLSSWYASAQAKDTYVVNTYGPSECTDISTFHVLEKPLQEHAVPIGKANDNVRLYVLDQHRSLMPEGLVGELYVGGVGVGAQYLGQPELNARKFFDNPFDEGLIYKTGDLVRWNQQGELDYIGRTDFQIKLRGVRIEPGEIENRIRQIASVEDALVLLDGQDSLQAYVLAPKAVGVEDVLIDTIQAELRRHFSANMIPSAFMVLGAFPLSPNGKVDRQALPAIEPS